MHQFQQEEYYCCRFFNTIIRNLKLIDKRLTALILVTYLLSYKTIFINYHLFALSILLVYSALRHSNPEKKAKKPLAITNRVKGIFKVFACLFFLYISAGLYIVKCIFSNNLFAIYSLLIMWIHLIPFTMILSTLILSPKEKKVRMGFLDEAKDIMKKFNPIVIGITGSYGKTSTKFILQHILSSKFSSLATPGSVNTEMGITRVIRENLLEEHKYFVVEMGAYAIGSIDNRCQLCPPKYGMITCIGRAHYERFKSVDNIAQTKFELANNIFKNSGAIILNSDGIEKKYIKKYCKDNMKNVSIFSEKKGEYSVSGIKEDINGLSFDILINSEKHNIQTPTFGKHQVKNIAMCIMMAHKNIGMNMNDIAKSLKSLPQTKYRLEVDKLDNGQIVINDAYNSNPIGFASALDTLKSLKQKGGRTILVTPGMIELGDLHFEKHLELGKKAGSFVDICLAVVPNRIEDFIKGFKEKAGDKREILEIENFAMAKKWLLNNSKANDVILYENDLPDLFEEKIKI